MIGAYDGSRRFDFGYNAFTSVLDNEVFFHSLDLGFAFSSGYTAQHRIIDAFTPYILNPKNNVEGDGTNIYFNGLSINNEQAGQFTEMEDAPFNLGADISGNRNHDGKVAEIIIYDGRNSNAKRRRIQSYLAIKYGVTLDQTTSMTNRHYYNAAGDVVWDAQRNQAYANDIAGIAKEAASCLEQAKSKSQNQDAILRIGGPADLDEGAFFIWGNNGEPLTDLGTVEAPQGFFCIGSGLAGAGNRRSGRPGNCF